MRLTGSLQWVAWNAFLALVPVLLAQVISRAAALRVKKGPVLKAGIVFLVLAWLAFLPNTCYLLTEWRHFLTKLDTTNFYLRSRHDSGITLRLMVEAALYFCYSGIGMLTFALAIRPVARRIKSKFAGAWILGIPLFLLLSVGVYLGLVLRYNSWDLIARPVDVGWSTAALVHRPKLSLFIAVFAAFLWLAYVALDIWIDGFLQRWRGLKKR